MMQQFESGRFYLELAKMNPKLLKHCVKNRRRLLQKEMAAEATAAKLGAR